MKGSDYVDEHYFGSDRLSVVHVLGRRRSWRVVVKSYHLFIDIVRIFSNQSFATIRRSLIPYCLDYV